MTDLSVGRAGPPDEAGIVSKGPRINTHLNIVKFGVEQHERVRPGKSERTNQRKERSLVSDGQRLGLESSLLEEMPVDFKLLLEHDLSPVLDDERVCLQVPGGSQDLPVFLDPCYPAQLELQRTQAVSHSWSTSGCSHTPTMTSIIRTGCSRFPTLGL